MSAPYRTNLPPRKIVRTPEEQSEYHRQFLGTLDTISASPFYAAGVQGRRFPPLDPANDESVTEEQKAYWEGPRTKVGPGNAWARTPSFTKLMNAALTHLNHKGSLPPLAKELAILSTARHFRSDFEWHSHAEAAKLAGISEDALREIREDRAPPLASLTEEGNAYYAFCWKLFHAPNRVDAGTWEAVRNLIGEPGAVELMGLMGLYTWVSFCLNVDEFPVPHESQF
ncbi:AhpD-like protein [Hyaloraphidium curvatum]|nr:AhpD-like protein [Hyaloraphidium curvatum]